MSALARLMCCALSGLTQLPVVVVAVDVRSGCSGGWGGKLSSCGHQLGGTDEMMRWIWAYLRLCDGDCEMEMTSIANVSNSLAYARRSETSTARLPWPDHGFYLCSF